jgi:uncharacterized protein YeaO (DUF488 family)
MPIRIKRVYDRSEPADGCRILVDRLWPRGLSKEKAAVKFWAKDVAPSNELRRWYGHAPEKWPEFKRRYFAELEANGESVAHLRREMGRGVVTLLFGSTETQLNNAVALKEYLESGR